MKRSSPLQLFIFPIKSQAQAHGPRQRVVRGHEDQEPGLDAAGLRVGQRLCVLLPGLSRSAARVPSSISPAPSAQPEWRKGPTLSSWRLPPACVPDASFTLSLRSGDCPLARSLSTRWPLLPCSPSHGAASLKTLLSLAEPCFPELSPLLCPNKNAPYPFYFQDLMSATYLIRICQLPLCVDNNEQQFSIVSGLNSVPRGTWSCTTRVQEPAACHLGDVPSSKNS